MEDHTHTTHQLSTMSIGQPRDAAADMDVDEDFASGNAQHASMPPPPPLSQQQHRHPVVEVAAAQPAQAGAERAVASTRDGCPSCNCMHGQDVRACCRDHDLQTTAPAEHQLHLWACACGEAHHGCETCRATAADPKQLPCRAAAGKPQHTILHVWAPPASARRAPGLGHGLHGADRQLPANVRFVQSNLWAQAPTQSIEALMQTTLTETTGRAHCTFLPRGHDDGS